jgi:CRISPR-associated exonuclease Cas4
VAGGKWRNLQTCKPATCKPALPTNHQSLFSEETMEEPPFTFRVIDLKQFVYCPRVLYYQTVLPDVRPITYKMEAGIEAHHAAAGREKRRSLRTYGMENGRRAFNVPVYNPALMLSGEVDMVIETDTELIPVDYKQAKKVGSHHKLQLMAYGRLLETADPQNTKAVNRGFIYLIPLLEAVQRAGHHAPDCPTAAVPTPGRQPGAVRGL